MLLNNQCISEEIKEEIKTYLETTKNESIMIPNLWDAAKAVLTGNFIAIQSYLKKQETSQINKLTLHPKQLEKERKKKTKSAEERHPKNQTRNKWKRNEGNNSKDQKKLKAGSLRR